MSVNQTEGKITALYERLSRDDDNTGDSNSIVNQKKYLEGYAAQRGYSNCVHYTDDGWSGGNFERPAWKKLVEDIEAGKVAHVLVKDLSRLGRNYREVGYYTEEFFPEHDIRFVSVSDGVDSSEGEDELAPFRNIMNEWYAKDISKKRRISNKVKGGSGEPLSMPPYGYIKDPDNPKRWIIDEEATVVVFRIFRMALDGFGLGEIASALDKDGILTPTHYWQSKGLGRGGKKGTKSPTHWNHSTIYKILSLQEYCGDVINFKTYSKSYKQKKRIENSEENRAIFWGVHEAIVDRATWEKVQQMRGSRKKSTMKSPERSIFSGLLKCADCGKNNLNFHFNQGNPHIKYFNCSNYNSGRGNCNATHYIRLDFLEQVVLQEVHRLTQFAGRYEEDFVKAIMRHSMKKVESERGLKQRALEGLTLRDKELDTLFERIYEDNVTGKISDERFSKMTRKYEEEQGEIAKRSKILRVELKKETRRLYTTDTFLEIVRRYTNATELTQRMVTELIDHIDVYHAERVDGEVTQQVVPHYHCIGAFEVPDWKDIPEIDILIETRKGVALSYTNEKIAV